MNSIRRLLLVLLGRRLIIWRFLSWRKGKMPDLLDNIVFYSSMKIFLISQFILIKQLFFFLIQHDFINLLTLLLKQYPSNFKLIKLNYKKLKNKQTIVQKNMNQEKQIVIQKEKQQQNTTRQNQNNKNQQTGEQKSKTKKKGKSKNDKKKKKQNQVEEKQQAQEKEDQNNKEKEEKHQDKQKSNQQVNNPTPQQQKSTKQQNPKTDQETQNPKIQQIDITKDINELQTTQNTQNDVLNEIQNLNSSQINLSEINQQAYFNKDGQLKSIDSSETKEIKEGGEGQALEGQNRNQKQVNNQQQTTKQQAQKSQKQVQQPVLNQQKSDDNPVNQNTLSTKKKSTTTKKQKQSKKTTKQKEKQQKEKEKPASNSKQKQEIESLEQLLKQKLKQIKTLQNKNSKLQTKYIEIFKQNKQIKKDLSVYPEIFVQTVEGIRSMKNGVTKNQQSNNNDLKNKFQQILNLLRTQSIVAIKDQFLQKFKLIIEQKIQEQLNIKSEQHAKAIESIKKQNQQLLKKELLSSNKKTNEVVTKLQHSIQALQQKSASLQTQLQVQKSQHQKQILQLQESHKVSMSQLKENLKNQLIKSSSHQLQQLSSIHQEQVNLLYADVEKGNNKVKQLQKVVSEMDEKLDQKNNQISRLMKQKLKLQHQINQYKVKQITQELQETQGQSRKQIQGVNQRNQMLKVRQQLEGMIQKRDQLRIQNLKLEKQLGKYKESLQQKNKEIQELLNQISHLRKQRNTFGTEKQKQFYESGNKQIKSKSPANITGNKQNQGNYILPEQLQIIKSSQQIPMSSQNHPQTKTQSSTNINKTKQLSSSSIISSNKSLDDQAQNLKKQQYLKNVFVRYVKSLMQNQDQSDTLLRVILTILNVNQYEKKQIELLSGNRKKWWLF